MGKYQKFYRPIKLHTDIVNADREEHGRLRRLLSHVFSDKSMRDHEPLIKGYLDLLIKRLHENCAGGSKPLDMVLWYNWTTFDIIGDLAFGEPFGCLERADYHPWVTMIFSMVKAGAVFQASAHFPFFQRLLISMIPKFLMAKREVHIQLTREKIRKRMALQTERPSLVQF
jgi:cytochrome P450